MLAVREYGQDTAVAGFPLRGFDGNIRKRVRQLLVFEQRMSTIWGIREAAYDSCYLSRGHLLLALRFRLFVV